MSKPGVRLVPGIKTTPSRRCVLAWRWHAPAGRTRFVILVRRRRRASLSRNVCGECSRKIAHSAVLRRCVPVPRQWSAAVRKWIYCSAAGVRPNASRSSQRSLSPLHQPLCASHQNPHHRPHPVHLRRAPPMCRPSLPDALQPLGRAWASAGAPMHPALPAGHRWCPARHARSGTGAASRGGMSQGQGYSPIRHAPLETDITSRNSGGQAAFSIYVFKSLAGSEIYRQRLYRG